MSTGSSSWSAGPTGSTGATGSGAADPPGAGTPIVARVLRALLALVSGVLIYTLLAWTFGVALGIETSPGRDGGHLQEQLLALAVAILLAAYTAAWIAGVWELPMGAGLGLVMGWGAGAAALSWQGVPAPLSHLVAIAVMVPAGFLGGALRARVVAARRRARGFRAPLDLPLTIRPSRSIAAFGAVLALGMTAAAGWVYWKGWDPLQGKVGLAVFGAAAALLLWVALVERRPFLVLRPEGIEGRAFHTTVPWSEVEGASISPLHPVELVRLHIRDRDRYLDDPSLLETALGANREDEEREVGVPTMGQPFTAEELIELVKKYAGAGRG